MVGTHLHDLVQNSHDAVRGGGEVRFGCRRVSITGRAALEDVHQGFATLADLRGEEMGGSETDAW